MELEDDRTAEQKKTHQAIVLMTDRFLSGWGKARGGLSYAGWACTENEVEDMIARLLRRSDAKNVRVVRGNYRPPGGPGHCHIYVAGGK